MPNATETDRQRSRDEVAPCPPWCAESDQACAGDHWSGCVYLPASAGGVCAVTPETGAAWPVVGVGLQFNAAESDAACVVLHVTGYGSVGHDIDENVFLRRHEAQNLAAALLEVASKIEGGQR